MQESTNPNDYLLQLVAQKKFLTGNKRNLIMYAVSFISIGKRHVEAVI